MISERKYIFGGNRTLQTGKSRGPHYRIGQYFARTSPKALPNGGYMPCFDAIGLGLTKDQSKVPIMTQKIASRSKNAIFIDKIRASEFLLPGGPVAPVGPKSLDHCVRGVVESPWRECSRAKPVGPVAPRYGFKFRESWKAASLRERL